LRCLVSTKGIEASPDRIKAILQMQPSHPRKEVQKQAGHIAALSRFIAKLAECNTHIFTRIKFCQHRSAYKMHIKLQCI
jgi:hypothetical protein